MSFDPNLIWLLLWYVISDMVMTYWLRKDLDDPANSIWNNHFGLNAPIQLWNDYFVLSSSLSRHMLFSPPPPSLPSPTNNKTHQIFNSKPKKYKQPLNSSWQPHKQHHSLCCCVKYKKKIIYGFSELILPKPNFEAKFEAIRCELLKLGD